jgi:uncharacterized damage-inducible protein DinB
VSGAGHLFTEKARALLREYLGHIERCASELTDADIWWRPNEASNSIGNLILHLCGNVRQWIVGGVGRQDYERDRQREFDERRTLPAAELLARLSEVLRRADDIIGAQTEASLTERRRIQGYDVTVLEAIFHVVEHFSMHTGQIVMLTKMRAARDLGLWQPPSP